VSAGTWADPDVFALSATSGSQAFHPVNTANLVVHASENSSTTYFQPSAALDHNNDTAWESATNPASATTSLTVRKPDSSSITVVSYTLVCRNGWQSRAPSEFTLYGSDDNSSWTSVDARTGQTSWNSPGNVKNFVLSTPATFKYWKLVVTATTTGDILNLGEIFFNDTENTTPPTTPSWHIKLTGVPQGRMVTLDFDITLGGPNWYNPGWIAYVASYPEGHEYTGYAYMRNPDGTDSGPERLSFYGFGGDIILKVMPATLADFTMSWTSYETDPIAPRSWFDREVLDPDGGTLTYDGTGDDYISQVVGSPYRFYSITPTSSDPLTISTDEPNCYYEIYSETGIWSYDDYIEDGYNLSDGTPDPDGGVLEISPAAGQEYVIVVYPEELPTPETTYTLTWSQASFVPPYVVSNDMVINATNLGLATSGMTHAYDNTGATTDPEVTWGKRSIWYRFHVDSPQALRLTLTASDSDPTRDPRSALFHSDSIGTTLASGHVGSTDSLFYNLEPTLEYYLMIYFDSSTPTSDWEQAGSMAFELKPIPPEQQTPTPVLEPGDANPGGGQNFHVGRVWSDQWWSAHGTVRIVAPSDGGLSIIVEAGDEGGTVYRPSADLQTPYGYQTYVGGTAIWRTDPYVFKTDLSIPSGVPQGPRWLPWRAVGETDPQPLTIRVKAGDELTVIVHSAQSGCYIRWGMASKDTPSDWFSARYGDVITQDGTYSPESGWTSPELWADVRANASAWPSNGPLEIASSIPGDTREPVVGYGGSFVGNNPGVNSDAGSGIRTNLMYPAFQDDIDGLNGGRTTDTFYTDTVRNDISYSALFDPGKGWTRQEMDTGLRMVRHVTYVSGNTVDQWNAATGGAEPDWRMRDESDRRMQSYIDANNPVVERAGNRELDAYRSVDLTYEYSPGYAYYGSFDTYYEMLQWSIEWEGEATDEPQPVWNTYHWVHAIGLSRFLRAPTDPLDGYTGTPTILPDPMNLRLYKIPLELSDQSWVLPEEIEADGEVIHEVDVPSEDPTGFANRATIQPVLSTAIYDAHDGYFAGPIPFDRDLDETNVLGGVHPTTGTVAYDITYAMMVGPYRERSIPIDENFEVFWNDHGHTAPHYFTHSPGGGNSLQAEMQLRTRLARLYPARFRVAKWIPSLAALAVEVPPSPQPGAGYYIVPNPNLDGHADGVDVSFASST
jgi:hypothetical protein